MEQERHMELTANAKINLTLDILRRTESKLR